MCFVVEVSYASLCMEAATLESVLGKKQNALEKVEHIVAQRKLKPDKVTASTALTALRYPDHAWRRMMVSIRLARSP